MKLMINNYTSRVCYKIKVLVKTMHFYSKDHATM